MRITRLAPSPTGELHLGNAWAFLLAWLAARSTGGKIYLRIDNLDPQRSKPHFIEGIYRDLEWLGLDWDGNPIFQSSRSDLYEHGVNMLKRKDLLYPCFCTRAELRRLPHAPHMGEVEPPYPGTCRSLGASKISDLIAAGRKYALRVKMAGEIPVFNDLIYGMQNFDKNTAGGDFVIRRSDGIWAYQLASVIDDLEMGVNLIIRGRDILSSTPRQLFLARSLGGEFPAYAHVPLILDGEGARLAKRHQSLSLASLRKTGVDAATLVGWLAAKGGLQEKARPCTPAGLLTDFNLSRVSPGDIRLGTLPPRGGLITQNS